MCLIILQKEGQTNKDLDEAEVLNISFSIVVSIWPLVLEVPGSILTEGDEKFDVRTCFPSCHLQGCTQFAIIRIRKLTGYSPVDGHSPPYIGNLNGYL